jgi:hypothetical protein
MRGERQALRAGEYLVSQACRRLPARIREERYQEWLAELPVILHDRDAGPAPLRMVRMLAFAAGTLRGTTLAPGAYRGAHRGAHRGGSAKTIRWLATGLLLLGALPCAPLFLLAWEGYIIDQLITGGGVAVGATLALTSLACFTAIRIRKRRHTAAADWWDTAAGSWYSTGKVAAGAGLLFRAIAGQSGWGHPLLFAIIGYCGYAISAACLGMAVALIIRSLARSSTPGGERGAPGAGPPAR